MESLISATDQQSMVSSFLEIAVGQTADTARQFLQATSWKFEEAIQLFYIGNQGRDIAPSLYSPQLESDLPSHDIEKDLGSQDVKQDEGDVVRPPLPVKRDVLYENPMLYGLISRSGCLVAVVLPSVCGVSASFSVSAVLFPLGLLLKRPNNPVFTNSRTLRRSFTTALSESPELNKFMEKLRNY